MRRLLSSQENIIDAWLQLRSNAGTTKLYNFPDSLCPVYARISLATQSSLQTMRSGNLSGSNQTSQIRTCSLASSQGIYGARYGLRSTGLQDKWDSRVEGGGRPAKPWSRLSVGRHLALGAGEGRPIHWDQGQTCSQLGDTVTAALVKRNREEMW